MKMGNVRTGVVLGNVRGTDVLVCDTCTETIGTDLRKLELEQA